MSFWDTQRQIAMHDLATAAGDSGRAVAEGWRAKRKQREFDRGVREAYVKALDEAKLTGIMPDAFQNQVPEDSLRYHIGIKAVTLRELGKNSPLHPLVKSFKARDQVGMLTLINFNRANRPDDDPDYDKYAPSDSVCQNIFKANQP